MENVSWNVQDNSLVETQWTWKESVFSTSSMKDIYFLLQNPPINFCILWEHTPKLAWRCAWNDYALYSFFVSWHKYHLFKYAELTHTGCIIFIQYISFLTLTLEVTQKIFALVFTRVWYNSTVISLCKVKQNPKTKEM